MSDPGNGVWHTAIHFRCNNEMPMMVYDACLATGTRSNTRYIQEAVCMRLATDLGIDYDTLLDLLPPGKTKSQHLWHPRDNSKHEVRLAEYESRISGSRTIEDVI